MQIAIIVKNYSLNHMLKAMLTIEKHTCRAYASLEQIERVIRTFDLLIYSPDPRTGAAERLRRLESIRPETRKIIITNSEEVLFMARQLTITHCLLMPFSRSILIAIIKSRNFDEKMARDIEKDHRHEKMREQQKHGS